MATSSAPSSAMRAPYPSPIPVLSCGRRCGQAHALVSRLPRFALLLLLILAAGCTPAESGADPAPAAVVQGGSCQLGLPADTADEEAIRAVLAAEGELVVAQDINRLMDLWAEESQVVDAKNTPDDTADDQAWRGKDAIRNRYARVVFPGAPSAVQPADLDIAVDGDQATVVATTQIGAEVSPAGDRWTLVRQDGCWHIESLTYNLEAQS